MPNPKRLSIRVSGTKYYLEVDVKKSDCNREPAHCHLTDGYSRIAQIWLATCAFKENPRNVSFNDRSRILDAVASNRYELEDAYNYNRDNGAL